MNDYHRIAKRDDRCSLCGGQASHKVAEDTYDHRHPFTNYLCCGCFGQVMGSLAVEWCARESGVPVGGGEPQLTTSTDPQLCETCGAKHTSDNDNTLCDSFRPVRSAGGGDQPDTPCPQCGGEGGDHDLNDRLHPCPACTDKENPHGH